MIEGMIDQVLEGQQKLMLTVNGKIDDVYNEPNAKFETLNIHVKRLETQMVQTGDAVKRQETFIKDKGDEVLKNLSQPSETSRDNISKQSEDASEPIEVDQATVGRTLRKGKEKVLKNLKRGANDKEMDSFTKRILRIPMDKPFEEAYFTHMLWMFFRETKETEEDIRRMFHQEASITLVRSATQVIQLEFYHRGRHDESSETLR
ncbi:hypothetical protein DY000_02007873 [Brassica cretica]|uniref:Uncharacterized protein n=1 Tax=Brassica cretica TaxID=69181 RepID=A0ABQ7BZ65_BRACR|nr:hypothetical protein DY000_02007873 [Brassica cretica]